MQPITMHRFACWLAHFFVYMCWTYISLLGQVKPAYCQSASLSSPQSLAAESLPRSLQADTLQTDNAQAKGKDGKEPQAEIESESKKFRTVSLRGKVVWLNETLKEKFGMSTVPEAKEQTLALLTGDGQLLPILEDQRGRSFRTDQRLRQMDIELYVRQYAQQPMLQIIRVYELNAGQRFEVDYWCDVCAIIMFESGPCACCQDDNRLRKRLVEK